MINHSDTIEQLKAVAKSAGAAIMDIYQNTVTADYKGDGSPVTLADKKADSIILPALQNIEPTIAIVSEENSASHLLTPPKQFFIVDPLDGTKEFLKKDGLGSFTVNIALIENNNPVLGVVYAPALDRLFYGSKNLGAFEEVHGSAKAIKIRNVPETGAVAVASVSHRDEQTDSWLNENKIGQTTSIGSSLKFCLLACGEADVYPRFGPTMEWDTAAGDAVLRAAGGRVVNPDYTPFFYAKKHYRNGPFIAYGGF